MEGRSIDLGVADAALARLDADLVLVEGAGGLLVPITAELNMADLAARWPCALLVVARASLGTINHTLLTLEAARHRGLRIAGVVLNRTAPPGPDDLDNAAAIRRHGRVAVFGTFPQAPEAAFAALADLADRHLDLQALWNAI
jgi:dethiobiotin synthetase